MHPQPLPFALGGSRSTRMPPTEISLKSAGLLRSMPSSLAPSASASRPRPSVASLATWARDLNPVRAKVVAVEKLGEFRWSSFWWFPKKKERPSWLCAETVLAEAGGLADTAAGWCKYGEYLGFLDEAEPTKRNERYGKLSRGWALGTAEFRQGLLGELKKRGAQLEQAVPYGETDEARRQLRESVWEDRLGQLARTAKIDLAKLGRRKSDPAKVLLAAALRAETGVSNGWLCDRLGMGTPASVSQFVRRWLMDGANVKRVERLRATMRAPESRVGA